jgi:hypothetical protein
MSIQRRSPVLHMPSLTLIADDGGREGFQSVLLQIDIAGCQEDFVTKKPMFENQ